MEGKREERQMGEEGQNEEEKMDGGKGGSREEARVRKEGRMGRQEERKMKGGKGMNTCEHTSSHIPK